MASPKNIGIFATPESEEALQLYMSSFSNSKEIYAADLGYAFYKDLLTLGQTWVQEFREEHDLPESTTIILITVAGMRWNLLDKDNDNDSTRITDTSTE